jgi:hypothetical protein
VAVAMAVAVASTLFEEDRDGITLVPTPFGWRPRQCVHRWPSGTAIRDVVGENRTHIILPNGEEVSLPRLPECMKFDYIGPDGLSHSRIQDGWLDNAGYYTNRLGDTTEFAYKFDGDYTVPTTPSMTGGLLYYFLGMENKGGSLGLTILQPVLTYYGGWTMASWNCCPNGQSHESTPISGFGPGNKVYGNMFESGPELTGTWSVESQYCPTTGKCQTTYLNVSDAGREFVWIDATLETYYVVNCNQLSSGLMSYNNMKLTTQNSKSQYQVRTIAWDNYTPTSACNGVTKVVSSASVTIKHN